MNTATVWAIVTLFGATILGSTLVAVFAEGGAPTLIAAMFANLVTVVAVLANIRVSQEVRQDTRDLRNGLLDAKIRAGVVDVLPNDLVDPAYRESGQYRRDDERRGDEG